MKKNLAFVSLSLILIFTALAAPANAQSSNWIPVYLDTEQVVFDEQPFSTGSRIMVGLRAVFEAFGSEVHWNGDLQKITSSNGDIPLEFVVGSTTYWIDGVAYESDAAPQIVGSRIFVPLRLIAECYDADVFWNPDVEAVIIYSKDYTPKTNNPQESEPNDKATTAVKIFPGQIVSGKFNGDTDIDYYALWINEEGTYQISIERGNVNQEPAFEVYNSSEIKLATSTSGNDGNHSASVSLIPGRYYISVSNLSDRVLDDFYKLQAIKSR